MSISEMFQLYGWWYVVLVALEIILLVVLFGGCLVLMYGDNRSWLYQKLSGFIDWLTEKYLQFITLHFTWDDEPECPEWADEERWEESLLEYKIKAEHFPDATKMLHNDYQAKCSGIRCPMHYPYDVNNCTLTADCKWYTE